MDSTDMMASLLQRLHAVGIDDVLSVEPSAEGMAAVADLATRRSGTRLFVKTFAAPPADDLFAQGDFWAQNILATADGEPAVIDPAVSYMWAEVDLSHLWCSPHPAEARRLFEVYGELTGREAGWLERLPLLHLRQHMALIAMYAHDWGSTEAIRALVAPFRSR
jgi:hypothetical protein